MEWSTLLFVAGAAIVYVCAVFRLRARGISWPKARTSSWLAGCLAIGAALIGPLAERAHHDFIAHMGTHVLLGMLGPLLLVLGAPVTVALRVLPVATARRIARGLASPPFAVLTNPFVAGLLNVGGLWILYRTGLFAAMHDDPLVHGLIHIHVLAAGYLFTFAVIGGPDPAPHRASPPWRVTALVLAIAAHNILAKVIYAEPPPGVSVEQAHAGAELMYYAGAPVEIALLVLVCRPWLLPRRPVSRRRSSQPVVSRADSLDRTRSPARAKRRLSSATSPRNNLRSA
ncbi:cytochrome c oxidase assembly protein [Gordonia sp. NPDC127522]|uniref:cytochrome c oxidase assembly protein n=1 Tax=Gordonia sp. NPDC127522 TaxID=3345390 RepID=UPI00362FB448